MIAAVGDTEADTVAGRGVAAGAFVCAAFALPKVGETVFGRLANEETEELAVVVVDPEDCARPRAASAFFLLFLFFKRFANLNLT